MLKLICIAGLLLLLAPTGLAADDAYHPGRTAFELMFGDKGERRRALRRASHRRDKAMIAPMLYALRYQNPDAREYIVEALTKITRKEYGDDWFRWMQYQQARPELTTFAAFDVFLSRVFSAIDPNFKRFVYPGMPHRIRLQEIVWGGVKAVDGIPALDHPRMIAPAEADYITDEEWVFGIRINGEARAYPYRFMDWHEMLNDTIGGMPISLAYCTLCGSGILFDARKSEAARYTFGSSGLLYRSNKLMYDQETSSLWNQFSGEPVTGVLADSGIKLSVLPLVTTTWERWYADNPDTTVMQYETGVQRDYRLGAPYGSYFRDPKLMFPSLTEDRQLPQKSQVFGLRISGAHKAWPLKAFRRGKVLNDQVGVLKVVLIGDAKTRQVRAYRSSGITFAKQDRNLQNVRGDGQAWQVTEAALVGADGRSLSRLPGHLAFWFAWHNFLDGDSLAD
ncbi:MAG: DUF3179 domain-containing protein [Pseudomonadota bacterium]